jgi:hypothetical protein
MSTMTERCVATSTVTMKYGCGHVITCANGDPMWPACPWCTPFLRREWGRRPEPRKAPV